jgi:hypothetical protein
MDRVLGDLLRARVRTAHEANFVCRFIVPVGLRPGQVLEYNDALDASVAACRQDPQSCTRLLQLLQGERDAIAWAAERFLELQGKARQLAEVFANKPEMALELFGGFVADVFREEEDLFAYLRVHAAPYAALNELRAALVGRNWNLGATKDDSAEDGLGMNGLAARTLYHVCLDLDVVKPPYRLQVL